MKALSGFYYVETAGETVECKARGRFRLDKISPLVGDIADIELTENGRGIITAIHERKNSFIRPPIANIDQILIFASGAIPITDPYLIDKMTVIAEYNNCESIICLNKSDLDSADTLFDIYNASPFKTIRTSAETGEGIDELKLLLKDKISVFAGNSGVGKSSILNCLEPEMNLSVGEVSEKLGRGRHTTRHVELFKTSFGAIIADTPGFSSFETEKMEFLRKEDLQHYFPEIRQHLGHCRFLDCAHIKEPKCAVLDAINNEIQKSRHNSYIRLYEQAMQIKEWETKQQ